LKVADEGPLEIVAEPHFDLTKILQDPELALAAQRLALAMECADVQKAMRRK
jgi:hypothetical protein